MNQNDSVDARLPDTCAPAKKGRRQTEMPTEGIAINRRLVPVCDEIVNVQIHHPVQVSELESDVFPSKDQGQNEWSSKVSIVGLQRNRKGFLTVGVPSIRRVNGAEYLLQTLASLAESVSSAEKLEVIVLIFLADLDVAYNNETLDAISQRFRVHLDSGFFRVMQVSFDYYPPLVGLKRNFGDAPDRVRWRAKQVADFSLMFGYGANLSDYYVQIEDDVESARGFVQVIRSYINERDHAEESIRNWAMLEFSELGFIGKLFRSSDLDRLARFMKMFYAEQPVDWLMSYFRLSMGQRDVFLRKPTVFQHFGLKSSFDLTKDNNLKDRFYDNGRGENSEMEWVNATHPSATVLSTMPYNEKYTAEMAYNSGSGFFWATKVRQGDTYSLVFDSDSIRLSRIVVVTGAPHNQKDILEAGSLYISPSVVTVDRNAGTAQCSKRVKVAEFRDGRAEALELIKYDFAIRCIQVVVEADQKHWALFRRVAVFQ